MTRNSRNARGGLSKSLLILRTLWFIRPAAHAVLPFVPHLVALPPLLNGRRGVIAERNHCLRPWKQLFVENIASTAGQADHRAAYECSIFR